MDVDARHAGYTRGVFPAVVGETAEGETIVNIRSGSRAGILRTIRQAVRGGASTCDTEYVAIPRDYQRVGQLDREELLSLFAGRLRDYDAVVYSCSAGEIAQTVAAAMTARGKAGLLRPDGLPEEWLPPVFRFQSADGWPYEETDRGEGVITGCVAAIAVTGTIILRHSLAEGKRALTLIPDYHLCIVFADQVVETVPEGFARLRGMETMPITTISGPSATADIEMTRVKGVHGPRFLDVILVV